MDRGTWTFRCRECGSAFEMPLTERERAGDFAGDKCCPSCGSAPRADCRHTVIGYRADKKPHPIIL